MTDTGARCVCGRIDVHAHFLPEVYAQALERAGMRTLDGGFPVPKWSAEAALGVMDRQDIATAMVSLSSPSTHFLPPAERPALARAVNDAGAALVQARPDRFGYFACLPMPDIEASLAEIRRAFDELGADGVVLQTNTDGVYLGSPAFAPILAELNRRKTTLFLHPTSPACFGALALGRPAPLLEFPLDTTRTIVDLLYSRRLQTNPASMTPISLRLRHRSRKRNSTRKSWEGPMTAFPYQQIILNLRGLGLSCAFGDLTDSFLH